MSKFEKKRTLQMLSMRFSNGGAQPPADPPPADPAPADPPPADKTFTRDELNKIVAAEKTKAVETFKAQTAAEQAEAEKLSKMKSDEKLAYSEQQAKNALTELNAYKLKAEAVKVASSSGLPTEFLDSVDFKNAKAEDVNALIEKMSKAFTGAVETALNEKLKQKPPESHNPGAGGDDMAKWRAEAGLPSDKK